MKKTKVTSVKEPKKRIVSNLENNLDYTTSIDKSQIERIIELLSNSLHPDIYNGLCRLNNGLVEQVLDNSIANPGIVTDIKIPGVNFCSGNEGTKCDVRGCRGAQCSSLATCKNNMCDTNTCPGQDPDQCRIDLEIATDIPYDWSEFSDILNNLVQKNPVNDTHIQLDFNLARYYFM